MWNLDDDKFYFKLLDVTIPFAFTWGSGDLQKRENIRRAIAPRFPDPIPKAQWWAFRLYAKKGGSHGFDVENTPKLVARPDRFGKNLSGLLASCQVWPSPNPTTKT